MTPLILVRYLFGPQSKFFLKDSDGHQNLAIKCMSYLSFDSFHTDLSDPEMVRFILRGDYVFQQYAESQWLEHVKMCALLEPFPSSSVLCQSIRRSCMLEETLTSRAWTIRVIYHQSGWSPSKTIGLTYTISCMMCTYSTD